MWRSGKSGQQRPLPLILERLAELLTDMDPEFRESTAEALDAFALIVLK